ncbi:nicotinate-nucleotide adenylyltransferase [Pullulanibacillus pueri]|uniref:Probable nicotinate-nucleotide adenylyltransferase n=1 Tax=Pullulanibacillus pueri TaxID=1437324 RepID=A0A8J2ZYM3_9BACL|nr:nicotinate-nucleotide adenylyltransferase [Pullulanibacillus pueri]MBM7683076.1 nicotinate-nucleotide adenylyltransferase [Pullulanibacillus pueri]GGH84880.1 nicotinate-nucleotide adenylyltransferase [Pullulanibacillus pueri]
MVKRIGLFGGAFDPPHTGHLILAAEAAEAADLDEVWFLPSYIPPHLERKHSQRISSAQSRIDMVRLSIEGESKFRLSLVEYEREGKSYTYDTVAILKEQYPDHVFYFIIGGDMVNDLPQWYKFEELKTSVNFLATKRAGVPLHPIEGMNIQYFDMPLIEISSSMIRERYRTGKPWHYFLPVAVKNYIEENGLYD